MSSEVTVLTVVVTVTMWRSISTLTCTAWSDYSYSSTMLLRQLQLSEYTCLWENQIIGRSVSYSHTISGAVPILTRGNGDTSDWPLYVTSNNNLCLCIRERWYTSFIFVHFVSGVHDYDTLDAQWRACLRLFRRKDATPSFYSRPRGGGGGKFEAEQKAKSNPNPIEPIHAGEMRL